LEGEIMAHATTDDSRSQYVHAMGSELGFLCHLLRDDLDWLRGKWKEHAELFEKGQKRIDLLNRAASNFFYFLHKIFFEDAMLHLCRLTDRRQMGDRKGLTVMALADLISHGALKASVQTKAEDAQKTCEFARTWRDRRLAHTDLVTLRQENALTLPEVNSADIYSGIKSIGAVLRMVEDHYGLPPTLLGPDPWGAESLVNYLERADRAIDEERRSWTELAKGAATNS
jgi:hypothetical protein